MLHSLKQQQKQYTAKQTKNMYMYICQNTAKLRIFELRFFEIFALGNKESLKRACVCADYRQNHC